jgi:acetyl-CoA carboxylase carboxyl transferase subunit beta
MNWLTNYVRPKIRAVLRQRKETPENLWQKCAGCGHMLHHKEFTENLNVCVYCGYHHRIAATARFELLFDQGEYSRAPAVEAVDDPLKFRDRRRYSERLKEARAATGERDAVMTTHGLMGGREVVVSVQNFDFMAGSLGVAAGSALVAAARLAVKKEAPLIVFTAAGGARMQEGALSLMQMPRTTVAVDLLREAGLPYIVVLTDPTTGGVTASYAMLGDVAIAEPGALIGFAGARVIEDTIRERLPEGFQRAEYLLEHGMLDMVVARKELRETLIRVITLLMDPRTPLPALSDASDEAAQQTAS